MKDPWDIVKRTVLVGTNTGGLAPIGHPIGELGGKDKTLGKAQLVQVKLFQGFVSCGGRI